MDITPGSGNGSPELLTDLGGTLLFVAGNPSQGRELWRSDGTPAGTWIVKDIQAGTGGSSPASITTMGSAVFFAANDGVNGTELWRSDGTAAGTRIVQRHQSRLGRGVAFGSHGFRKRALLRGQ